MAIPNKIKIGPYKLNAMIIFAGKKFYFDLLPSNQKWGTVNAFLEVIKHFIKISWFYKGRNRVDNL